MRLVTNEAHGFILAFSTIGHETHPLSNSLLTGLKKLHVDNGKAFATTSES